MTRDRESEVVRKVALEIEVLLGRTDKPWLWANSYTRAEWVARAAIRETLGAMMEWIDREGMDEVQSTKAVIWTFARSLSISLSPQEEGK